MKRILLTLAALVSIHSFTEAQNFGIDIATPAQKLDVAGAMRLGTTSNGVAGSLRWTGTEFQFHDGTQWNTLSGNSDNQNLDVFNLSGTDLELSLQNDGQATQTVDLSGFMDNTDDQTFDVFTLNGTDLELSLEDDGQATQTLDLDPLRRLLLDADTDTKVQVEESADEDIIRFDLEGTERWVMVGSRLEPKNSGNSVFIGSNSGAADNLTSTNRNTAVGTAALSTNISGGGNVAMGSQALTAATSSSNTAVGKSAMIGTTTGTDNVAVGKDALLNNLGGSENVAIGESSSIGVTTGTQNTVLGAKAGTGGTGTRSGNVYLGYNAGTGATGSNQLFIENSNSANPLIYGEFDNDLLRVNGTLNVNNAYDLPTADGTTGYVISTDGSGTATFQDPTALLATNLNTLDQAYDEGGAGAGRIITADNGAVEIQGAGGLVNEGNLTMTTDDAWVGIGASAGRIVFDQTANPDRLNVSDANVGMEDGNWIGVDASSPRMVFNDTDGEVDIANANIEIDEDKWIGASGATERIQFEGADDEINILGATGGVGIGTSDPTTELDVNGKIRMRTGSTVGFIPVGDANGVMTWTDPQTLSVLSLEDADGDTKVQVEESADEDYIRFDTFGTERMLIDKTGNVGVGLGAGDLPARILDVEAATGAKVVIGRDGATTTGDILGELHFDGRGPGGGVSSVDASAMLRATAAEPQTSDNKGADLSFHTKAIDANGNVIAPEHVRIASTGNVGVGITVPLQKLHVVGNTRISALAGTGTRGVYSNAIGDLTNTGPTSGVDGYWSRAGINLSPTALGDNVGVGIAAAASKLHVMGKTNIHQSGGGGGQNRFEGLETPTSANGRAQLVLSSAYSDLVIASSQANGTHGSTLTFATYNPGNAADYRKFVVNQGNWGARRGFLDFGYSDAGGRTNPHWNINTTDNVLTLDGFNKRVGIGAMSPAVPLHVAASPSGWQTYFHNAYGGSAKAYAYFSHGATYGSHIRSYSTSDGIYALQLYNNTSEIAAFWASGRTTLGQVGNVGIGSIAPTTKLVVNNGTTTLSRDATYQCCGNDATLALGEATTTYGRRASISFHNGGVAEGTMTLAQYNMAGTTYARRRIRLYDNQSQGMGLEISGDLFYGTNSSRTQTRDNNTIMGNQGALSGFYETSSATSGEGYPAGAGGWWHLLDSRHSNNGNRYAMQIAGSFYDQNIWFRKTANNGSAGWKQLAAKNDVFTTYIRWGRDDCPANTTMVYSGFAAGGRYDHSGSGANTICLTNSPNWTGSVTSNANNNGGLVYGTEFQASGYGVANFGGYSSGAMQDSDARCVRCQVTGSTATLMVPGTTQCPGGWTSQYWGYLMSSHYTQRKSEFVCVDNSSDRLGNLADSNGNLWYPVEAELGALTSPYQHDRELVCAVCSK